MPITRRSFGQFLALLVGGAFARPLPAAARAEPLLDLAVAGGRYHGMGARRGGLTAGTRLLLAREAENPFDRNAVAVLAEDGLRLGYVPRAAAGRVAALLDAGERLEAEVVGPLPDLKALPNEVACTDPFPGDPLVRLSRLT